VAGVPRRVAVLAVVGLAGEVAAAGAVDAVHPPPAQVAVDIGALSSRARSRRIAVLQLLGASTRVIAALAAVTTGALAAIGALLGCAIAGPMER
jgi:hypothetical protein